MNPGSSRGQSSGSKLPSWPILNSDDVEPPISKKLDTPANHDQRSQNVVSTQRTRVARGSHGSSSTHPAHSQDSAEAAKVLMGIKVEAEVANAATALMGMPNSSGSERAPQTAASQPMMEEPAHEERKICIEHKSNIQRMFKAAHPWIEMGGTLGVRPGAWVWMWKKELKVDTPQAVDTRHRAQVAESVRKNREKAKANKSGGQ